jgi:hypothetical protein
MFIIVLDNDFVLKLLMESILSLDMHIGVSTTAFQAKGG